MEEATRFDLRSLHTPQIRFGRHEAVYEEGTHKMDELRPGDRISCKLHVQQLTMYLETYVMVTHGGHVWAGGANTKGQLGCGLKGREASPTRYVRMFECGVREIALGPANMLVLTNSGELWGSGDNSRLQLGAVVGDAENHVPSLTLLNMIPSNQRGVRDVRVSSVGIGGCTVFALLSNGVLVRTGADWYVASFNTLEAIWAAPQHDSVVSMGVGRTHVMLATRCGRLFGCGDNRFGQLGTGDLMPRTSVEEIAVSFSVTRIFCTDDRTILLSGSRDAFAAGRASDAFLPRSMYSERSCHTFTPIFSSQALPDIADASTCMSRFVVVGEDGSVFVDSPLSRHLVKVNTGNAAALSAHLIEDPMKSVLLLLVDGRVISVPLMYKCVARSIFKDGHVLEYTGGEYWSVEMHSNCAKELQARVACILTLRCCHGNALNFIPLEVMFIILAHLRAS